MSMALFAELHSIYLEHKDWFPHVLHPCAPICALKRTVYILDHFCYIPLWPIKPHAF